MDQATSSSPLPPSPPPPVLEYGTKPRARAGMGAIAVTASILLPGLGHYLVGDCGGAKRWFGLFLAILVLALLCTIVPLLVPALFVLFPISVVVQIATWISAFRAARRSDRTICHSAAPRFVLAIAFLVIAAFAPLQYLLWPVKKYVVEAKIIPTASMSPTMVPGDCFLIHKLKDFKRFDIVAFESGDPRDLGAIYVKRVVGFPGETIEIKNGGVSVNGQVLMPPSGVGPYLSTIMPMRDARELTRSGGRRANGIEGNPITLGPDEYYVLGDNSPISGDSRFWSYSVDGHQPGTLPRSRIKGTVTWIYWPIARARSL